MKTKILTLFAALFLFSLSNAQTLLKNDGATMTIEPGAMLIVQGGVENTNGGTIDNDGTIEVEGDLTNNANLDDAGTIVMSGGTDAQLTTNEDPINNLVINKSSMASVHLQDSLTILSSLAFAVGETGFLDLGTNNLGMQPGSQFSDPDPNGHIVTSGDGHVVWHDLGVGKYLFPVGTAMQKYNPIEVDITAGTGTFEVRATGIPTDGDGETGTDITENVLDEAWDIDLISGSPTVDVVVHWDASHEQTGFDRANSAVAKNDGAGWDMLAADRDAAVLDPAPPTGTGLWTQKRTNVGSFSIFTVGSGPEVANELALTLDLWLEGPYNGVDMNTGLIDNQLAAFPLTEPHTGFGYEQRAFGGGESTLQATLTGNNVVDWVLVELRDGGDNTSILATKSGLLLDNGMVANPDGTVPLIVPGLGDGNYYVVVKHKNSLSAMTASPVDFTTGSAAVSFKSNTGVLGGASAQADLGSGQFGLWEADVNGSGIIDATDRSLMWNDRNQTGYLRTDSNLSGISDASDRSNAWNNRNKGTSVPVGN